VSDPVGRPRRAALAALWAVGGVVALAVAAGATTSVGRLGRRLLVPGPNSVGEEGKLFFALRAQRGESIFLAGDRPPYYGSFHGALLHGSVGLAARAADLSPLGILALGRAVSVLGTLVALGAAAAALRGLGARWPWAPVLLGLWLCGEPVIEHAVSYRPDHWNLALSATACALLVWRPEARGTLAFVVVAPAVAFFVKAPGLWILAPAAAALAARGDLRGALAAAFGPLALVGAGVTGLELASDGAFLRGARSGLGVPFGAWLTLAAAAWPLLWIPLAFPLATVRRAWPPRDPAAARLLTVHLFWLGAALQAAVTAARFGSSTYYFVDAWTFGLVLLVAHAAEAVRARRAGPAGVAGLLAVALAFAALAGLWTRRVLVADPRDTAVLRTLRAGPHRARLAAAIEAGGWRCYSDDPGLNALLREPQVIYPRRQVIGLETGRLAPRALLGPVEAREHDVVLLTGIYLPYRGLPGLPRTFFAAVAQRYDRLGEVGPYAVYARPGSDAAAALARLAAEAPP